jgi:hypothetical protein
MAVGRIVTTTYRYKRPAKKRKAVALEAPAIVAAKSRRPTWEDQAAAEVQQPPAITTTGQRAQSSTPREAKRGASSPANDGRKPTIVTARKPRGDRNFSDAPDLTPEELSGAAMPPTRCARRDLDGIAAAAYRALVKGVTIRVSRPGPRLGARWISE